MKEATGELSTTAIAIVAIGLILAIFTTILLPTIRSQIALNQACNSGPGYTVNNEDGSQIKCGKVSNGASVGKRTWTCYYYPKDSETSRSSKTCSD